LHLDEEETQFMNGTKTAYRIAAIRIVAALGVTVSFANETFCAAIVFEQTRSGTRGVASTKSDVVIQESQGYDNFVIVQEVEISAVHWSGSFFGPFNADSSIRPETDFRIQFLHDQAGNMPRAVTLSDPNAAIRDFLLDGGKAGVNDGTQVQENTVGHRPDDGSPEAGGAIVRYEANLTPFVLAPGDYWLSIQAQQTFAASEDPEWTWSLSDEGDKRIFSYDELFDPIGSQPGLAFPRDATFTLFSDEVSSGILGDFDQNGVLAANDIDLLSAAIRNNSSDSQFDLDNNGAVNIADHTFWVESVFGTLLGDADLDKQVLFADFLALADNFGQAAGWAGGDFDGDNDVRFADFVTLAQNFGLSGSAASTSFVPEPSSQLNSLFVLLLGFMRITKRSRKSVDVTVAPVKL
jgi:hypothetical protein